MLLWLPAQLEPQAGEQKECLPDLLGPMLSWPGCTVLQELLEMDLEADLASVLAALKQEVGQG
jgi:hypothetical protein